jgi:hypothetical protein
MPTAWVFSIRTAYVSVMGVRPPPTNNGSEPDVVTFGIAALDAHLDAADLVYPVNSETLIQQLGDPNIPYDAGGGSISLSEALSDTPRRRFESEQELLNTLHPVFEAYRENAGSGLFAQLRSMLPF